MDSFDRAARTYNTHAWVQRDLAQWLAEWLPSARKGLALEVASGTGLFTQKLLPWAGRLIATDASPAMVRQGAAASPEAEWRVAAADDLPAVPADWIFSSSFLQWAQDPDQLLTHWRSRLAPGGRILAGCFVAPTLAELQEVLPDASPLCWRTASEWEDTILHAGLTLIRAEQQTRTYRFSSSLDLFRSLHGVGAAPSRKLAGAALRAVARRYDERFGSKDGVPSTWTLFRFEAGRQ
jgi:malonyl-CoA O-methyltransferase